MHDVLNVERRLISPLFQRRYVWTRKELEVLWDDIAEVVNQEESDERRFLGAIVLRQDQPGTSYQTQTSWIVDGQQRITSLYMLIVAAASLAQEAGQDEIAADLEQRYLLHNLSDLKHQPTIQPTFDDYPQFIKILSELDNPQPVFTRPAQPSDAGDMYFAYSYLREQLESQVTNDDDSVDGDLLKLFINYVTDRLEFVEISLGERHDPHEIYDRLNTGGQALKIADLIRNIVFQQVGSDLNSAHNIYNTEWRQFEQGFTPEDSGDRYYYPFTQIVQPTVTKARQWNTLKDHWKTLCGNDSGSDAAKLIIEDLSEYQQSFNLIMGAPEGDLILDPDVDEALAALRRMVVSASTYPYLMQLLRAHERGEVTAKNTAAALRLVDSFLVRRAFEGLEATGLKIIFQDMWPRCRADLDEIKEKMRTKTVTFPSDERFREAILSGNLYARRLAKYVLTEYELSLVHDQSKKPLEGFITTMTIDHIMPQERKGDWLSTVSQDEHTELINTWGNLTPLSQPDNSSKGTGSWAAAKNLYLKENHFMTTKSLANAHDSWTACTIRQRNSELVDWALSRWPS